MHRLMKQCAIQGCGLSLIYILILPFYMDKKWFSRLESQTLSLSQVWSVASASRHLCLVGTARLHSISTNGVAGDCGPSCLQITNKLLQFSFGLIHHLSRDHLHIIGIILELQPEDDCWCDYLEIEKCITISHWASCWWSCRQFQPVCRSKIWSLIPSGSSLVSPMVMERLEWILWTGVLYTPNKL